MSAARWKPSADDVSQAIKDAAAMRESHRKWVSYIARGHATAGDLKLVGSQEEHEALIEQYERIIDCLRAFQKSLTPRSVEP
jgi:hypothetical protein